MRNHVKTFGPALLMFAAIVFVDIPAAFACGGLFDAEPEGPSVSSRPLLQEAEGIVFVAGEDTVTAVVRIGHTGGERNFAWLLPVQGTPVVGLSTRRTFEELLQRTAPVFSSDRHYCEPFNSSRNSQNNTTANNTTSGNNSATNNTTGTNGGPRVEVLDEGVVGPYEYDTITVSGGGDADGEVARAWLEDNGYAVDDEATSLLGSYLDVGMNIIAFKLASGADSRDIRPVSLEMEGTDIMLPLRLASVGAAEDTVIRVWVLGPEPAVTTNVPDVELNECAFDWSGDVWNYVGVLGAAVDEADGRAFVTEFAGPQDINDVAYPFELRDRWQYAQDSTQTDLELVNYVATRFVRDDGLRAALRETSVVVDFDCVEARGSYCEPSDCNCVADLPEEFVRQDFLDAVERLVIEPARSTQELLDSQPIVTSFHTLLSPDEMDVDVAFAFNADRPPVEGGWNTAHHADAFEACDQDGVQISPSPPWRWELPGGCVVWARDPASWPLLAVDMPTARRIVQYRSSGEPGVVADNAEEIEEIVGEHNAPFLQETTDATSGGGCTCRVTPNAPPPPMTLVMLAAITLLGFRRNDGRRKRHS